MDTPLRYSLEHANGTVNLTLASDRLVVHSQGYGLIDRPRTLELELKDLRQFYVTGVIAAQTAVQRVNRETIHDATFNSELLLAFEQGGRVARRRIFVDADDAAFKALYAGLEAARPDASLASLEPAEALKRMGMVAPSDALRWIIGLIVGIPVTISLLYILSLMWR